jgi:hypothetical protein
VRKAGHHDVAAELAAQGHLTKTGLEPVEHVARQYNEQTALSVRRRPGGVSNRNRAGIEQIGSYIRLPSPRL